MNRSMVSVKEEIVLRVLYGWMKSAQSIKAARKHSRSKNPWGILQVIFLTDSKATFILARFLLYTQMKIEEFGFSNGNNE